MAEKTVVITGSGAGIGRVSALVFAEAGINVVVSDVNVSGGEETVKLVTQAGGKAVFVRADVSKAADADALVAESIKAFGGLDYAFNNAGIEATSTPFTQMTDETWAKIIAVNLTGVFHCVRAELRHMTAQKRGAIVNMASIAALVGFAGSGAYCASKHGVIGITQAAALEVAKLGIRVNAICPGVIHTAMIDRVREVDPEMIKTVTAGHPMGRIGEPAEVGKLALALCRDLDFVTGQAIAIDGGYTAQ